MKKAYDVKKTLLLALPLLFGSVAHADDKNDLFAAFGSDIKCQDIVDDLNSKNKAEFIIMEVAIRNYILGYLTAHNIEKYIESGKKVPSMTGSDLKTDFMLEYAKNYCLHHPTGSLPFLTIELTKDLEKKPIE